MRFSTKRGIVALVVFLSVVVGLVVHTGTGTVSALGWRDIAAICPVGALEALAGARALLVHPIVLLVAVLLIAFLIGKAFCSWVCPVPHIRRFFHPKRKRDDGNEVAEGAGGHGAEGASETAEDASETVVGADGCVAEDADETAVAAAACEGTGAVQVTEGHGAALEPVGGERDGVKVDSRHAVLLGAVASSFAFGFPVFCLICPVGLSFAVVIGLWNLLRFNEASWGLIVFPVLILIEIVFFRKWCTKFCPISALLSLVAARSKTLRPVVEKHSCLRGKGVDCRACVQACPERVDPHSSVIPECSRCGDCVDKCPAHAIEFKLLASTGGNGNILEKGEGK